MPAIDFKLNDLPLRGDAQAISLASGANPFAPRSAGGTTYKDFSIWSAWAQDTWQPGGLKVNPENGGFLYAEAETRLPNRITLPLRRNAIVLDGLSATASDRAHFTTCNNLAWLGYGKRLYRWDGAAWDTVLEFDNSITDIAEFAGRIFVGFGSVAAMQSVDPIVLSTVTETPRADLVVPFGGLLYVSSTNTISYTNYEGTTTWEGPLRISSANITGIAGSMNGSLLEQILYITTADTLYALLAGDNVLEVSKFSGSDSDHGSGTLNHMGDVYVPLGRSVLRITAAGDMIPMGPDLGTGLPRELDGHVIDLASTLTFMYALVSPVALNDAARPSVWAWSGEGWHQVMQGDGGRQAAGLHYDRITQQLFMLYTDGSCVANYLPDDTTALRRADNLHYELLGNLDTGHYFGTMRDVVKLWGDVTIHGCFPEGTKVTIYYSLLPDEVMCGSNWSSSDVAWTPLGAATATGQRLSLPNAASAYLRLKLVLESTNAAATPMITAIVVRYIPRIVQQWAWNLSIKLPFTCLTYRDGSYVAEYNQTTWDATLRQHVISPTPLIFADIDGARYYVSVTAFTRRVTNVHCAEDGTGDELEGDILWTLSLLQLIGDITDGLVVDDPDYVHIW